MAGIDSDEVGLPTTGSMQWWKQKMLKRMQLGLLDAAEFSAGQAPSEQGLGGTSCGEEVLEKREKKGRLDFQG